MRLVEVTLHAEQKRSDGNYGSDTEGAFVKLEVETGDDVDVVLSEGRRLLRRALHHIPPTPPATPEGESS